MNKEIPDPGTEEAIKMGCICPVMDNEYGRGWMGQEGVFIFNMGCPVHAGDSVKEQIMSEQIKESRSKHPLTNKQEAEEQTKKFMDSQPTNKEK